MSYPEKIDLVTDSELREHIAQAKTAALLMLVAHMTDDPMVLRPEWRPDSSALPKSGLDPQTDREIRQYCLDRLEEVAASGGQWSARPSDRVLTAIGDWVLGPQSNDVLGMLDAALVMDWEDQQLPDWTADQIAPGRPMRVGIVGAGLSGLLAAARMTQAGVPCVVYEKSNGVGGTWHENTYPGCRIDVYSHIYTYSFVPYEWPSYFAEQDVMLTYLNEFVDRYGLRESIRLNTEVSDCEWDEERQSWKVTSTDSQGVSATEEFSILVSAVGQLNRPSLPSIAGRETFAGPAFHSAEWDHSVDLAGKNVAVIGTGASAVQFAPAIAKIARRVTIFQRNAPWLLPVEELKQPLEPDERWLISNLPLYRAYYRFSIFLPKAIGNLEAATVDPDFPPTQQATSAANAVVRNRLVAYLESRTEGDPELLQAVTPTYPVYAKRAIRDDGTWFSFLRRDNVRLVTDRIDHIDADGIALADGEHIDADVILYGTGFRANEFLTPMSIKGRHGVDLRKHWGDQPSAFLGMMVPGFPNLFCLYGPNTNLVVHGNLIFFIERQVGFLTAAVKHLLETRRCSMSVREEVFDDYRRRVDEANAMRVWAWSDVSSWYKSAQGRSAVMWPLSAIEYFEATRQVVPGSFDYT